MPDASRDLLSLPSKQKFLLMRKLPGSSPTPPLPSFPTHAHCQGQAASVFGVVLTFLELWGWCGAVRCVLTFPADPCHETIHTLSAVHGGGGGVGKHSAPTKTMFGGGPTAVSSFPTKAITRIVHPTIFFDCLSNENNVVFF